jgi:hypothetical protein
MLVLLDNSVASCRIFARLLVGFDGIICSNMIHAPYWIVFISTSMSADQGGFMSEQISAFPGRCVCPWVGHDPLYLSYHDHEWGIPVHDDHRLFELLSLEAMQAGLSWITILRRRDSFRAAFDAFNPELVAQYDESKIKTLLANPGIIRNRRTIEAILHTIFSGHLRRIYLLSGPGQPLQTFQYRHRWPRL